MRRGIGLSSLIRLATLAALGVWLLGGCASTTSPVDTRVGQSDPATRWRPAGCSQQAAWLSSVRRGRPDANRDGL
jgi:hypothetical protein